jgi:hypothetical protein
MLITFNSSLVKGEQTSEFLEPLYVHITTYLNPQHIILIICDTIRVEGLTSSGLSAWSLPLLLRSC